MNREARQYVTAWWMFHCADFKPNPEPDDYLAWIREAEEGLEECDETLAREYDEYIPQRTT